MRAVTFSAIVAAFVLALHPIAGLGSEPSPVVSVPAGPTTPDMTPQPYTPTDDRIAVAVIDDCSRGVFGLDNCTGDTDANRAFLVDAVSQSLSRLGFDAVPADQKPPNMLVVTVTGIAYNAAGSTLATASATYHLADSAGSVRIGTFDGTGADNRSSLQKLAEAIAGAVAASPARSMASPPTANNDGSPDNADPNLARWLVCDLWRVRCRRHDDSERWPLSNQIRLYQRAPRYDRRGCRTVQKDLLRFRVAAATQHRLFDGRGTAVLTSAIAAGTNALEIHRHPTMLAMAPRRLLSRNFLFVKIDFPM